MIEDIKYEVGTRLEIIRLMLLATMEDICRQDFDNITQLNLNKSHLSN